MHSLYLSYNAGARFIHLISYGYNIAVWQVSDWR